MRRKRLIAVLIVLVLAVVGMGVLAYSLLDVREITVEGNEKYTDEYLVELSGLEYGENILNVDKQALKDNLETLPDVVYISMQIALPDRVTITVYERKPVMAVETSGAYLIVDEEGVILDVLETDGGYPVVNGIPMVNMNIGTAITDSEDYRLAAMSLLYEQLRLYGVEADVARIDISNVNSIKLTMKCGFLVKLGAAVDFDEKIRWVCSVMGELQNEGITAGTIDVTTGDKAAFAPEASPATATPTTVAPTDP